MASIGAPSTMRERISVSWRLYIIYPGISFRRLRRWRIVWQRHIYRGVTTARALCAGAEACCGSGALCGSVVCLCFVIGFLQYTELCIGRVLSSALLIWPAGHVVSNSASSASSRFEFCRVFPL